MTALLVLVVEQVRLVNSTVHLTGKPNDEKKEALRRLLKPSEITVSGVNKRYPPSPPISLALTINKFSVGLPLVCHISQSSMAISKAAISPTI